MTMASPAFATGPMNAVAFALTLLAAAGASAETSAQISAAAPATIIVVRHAEKVDDSRDPDLSESGLQRAQALAEVLEHAGLGAAYASQYKRTRLTAMPAARAAGIPVRIEPIEGDVAEWAHGFAATLARDHAGQTVLVVGHSNTVPPLVAALCRCEVAPLADSDYDRIYILNMVGQGAQPRFDLVRARYGKP